LDYGFRSFRGILGVSAIILISVGLNSRSLLRKSYSQTSKSCRFRMLLSGI